MGEYIQLVDRSITDKKEHPVPGRSWDCFLRGELVGRIDYYTRKADGYSYYYASVVLEKERISNRYSMGRVGDYKNLYEAKTALLKPAQRYLDSVANEAKRAPAAYLPALDSEFYPTPSDVAGKLLALVDWKGVETVLEPSAGKGDLIDHAYRSLYGWYSRISRHTYYGDVKIDVDCIELDSNLRAIIESKGYRIVHDDFLTFFSRKRYDLYVMNPPFSEGDEHLLHALELCESGGQIACILNAETLRNPYTNTRRLLIKKLADVGATIRYVDDAFAKAQRRAEVDIALINVNIPHSFTDDTLWENLKKAQDVEFENAPANELAPADNIERLLREYDLTCDAGIALMRTYNGVAPHLLDGESKYTMPIISLSINKERVIVCDSSTVNAFLREVRLMFWRNLFDLPMLRDKMTTQMRGEYDSLITDMRDYEFSRFNIQQVLNKIMGQLSTGIEESIIRCFDKLSSKHTYNRGVENENIHYYNGWKTNKAHSVNMRCIIPTWGCYAKEWKPDKNGNYRDVYTDINPNACFGVLDDLEKALDYLDSGETIQTDLRSSLENAATSGVNRNIDCKYFTVTFYKKGTCHIAFKDKKIVERLNIFVGRNRAWLPPYYGKVRYEEMDDEGRRIIDEFQGREAYENVVTNQRDYLIDVQSQLRLME